MGCQHFVELRQLRPANTFPRGGGRFEFFACRRELGQHRRRGRDVAEVLRVQLRDERAIDCAEVGCRGSTAKAAATRAATASSVEARDRVELRGQRRSARGGVGEFWAPRRPERRRAAPSASRSPLRVPEYDALIPSESFISSACCARMAATSPARAGRASRPPFACSSCPRR